MIVQRVIGGLVIGGCSPEEEDVLYNTVFAAVAHYKLCLQHIGPMPVVDKLLRAYGEDMAERRGRMEI